VADRTLDPPAPAPELAASFIGWLDEAQIAQLDAAGLRAVLSASGLYYDMHLSDELREAMSRRALELLPTIYTVIELLDLLPLLPPDAPVDQKVKRLLKFERRPEYLSLMYDMTEEWPEIRQLVIQRVHKLISNMKFERIHEQFECFIQLRGPVDIDRAGGYFFCFELARELANRAISVVETLIALDAARKITSHPHLRHYAEACVVGAIRGKYDGEPLS